MSETGYWTNARINRLRYDVKRFFRAYYSEVRRQIAEAPDAEAIPPWFRGGRRIEITLCADGIVVGHRPYDEEAPTFPNGEDAYTFALAPGVMTVKEVVARYKPPFPPGKAVSALIPDYAPGEDFGARYWSEPLRRVTPMDDKGRIITEASKWTRLDYASMNRLGAYRDLPWAREQARHVLRPYLNANG